MKRLVVALSLVVAAAAVGALVEAGCATSDPNYQARMVPEPDGGWARYVPAAGPTYGPNPAAAAAASGNPQLNTVVPVGYSPLK